MAKFGKSTPSTMKLLTATGHLPFVRLPTLFLNCQQIWQKYDHGVQAYHQKCNCVISWKNFTYFYFLTLLFEGNGSLYVDQCVGVGVTKGQFFSKSKNFYSMKNIWYTYWNPLCLYVKGFNSCCNIFKLCPFYTLKSLNVWLKCFSKFNFLYSFNYILAHIFTGSLSVCMSMAMMKNEMPFNVIIKTLLYNISVKYQMKYILRTFCGKDS